MPATKLSGILKKNNCRLTNARIEIFELLQSSPTSLSVKEILEKLENKYRNENNQATPPKKESPLMDRVSVYRNLTLFKELGLAHKFQDGSFSLCQHNQSKKTKNHVHFINHCTDCGKKSELTEHSAYICDLAKKLKQVSSSLKTLSEIIIQGRCAECDLNDHPHPHP